MGIESRGYREPEQTIEQAPPKEEKRSESIDFPFGEVAVEAYLKDHPDQTERGELLRKVFQELFQQELDHSAIFR